MAFEERWARSKLRIFEIQFNLIDFTSSKYMYVGVVTAGSASSCSVLSICSFGIFWRQNACFWERLVDIDYRNKLNIRISLEMTEFDARYGI